MTTTFSLSCSVIALTTVVFPDPDPPAIPIIIMILSVEIPGQAGDDVVVYIPSQAGDDVVVYIPGQAGDDVLILCVLWSTWEWDHVTNVAHTGNEQQETFETETESTVRCRSEAACVKIPLKPLAAHASLLNTCF